MISINATLLVQIINLLLLIFLLNRFFYKPIQKIIEQRAETIEGGKVEADQLLARAGQEHTDYKAELNQGRQQVRQRLEEVRKQAEAEAKQAVQKAHNQAREEADQLMANIKAQMDQARGDIRQQAETVARSMASRLLGREVS